MSTFFNIYKVTVDLNLFLDNFFLQRAGDTPVLLTKNEIKALKKLVFSTVQKTFKIARVKDADFDAWNVHLNSVLVWAIREQHLHSCNSEDKEFNIKLDGRPLGGMSKFLRVVSLEYEGVILARLSKGVFVLDYFR